MIQLDETPLLGSKWLDSCAASMEELSDHEKYACLQTQWLNIVALVMSKDYIHYAD